MPFAFWETPLGLLAGPQMRWLQIGKRAPIIVNERCKTLVTTANKYSTLCQHARNSSLQTDTL